MTAIEQKDLEKKIVVSFRLLCKYRLYHLHTFENQPQQLNNNYNFGGISSLIKIDSIHMRTKIQGCKVKSGAREIYIYRNEN